MITAERAGASPAAIQSHYDVGNDFFALWLDPEMVYSCAMFEEGDSLETAQLRKLDYHISEARATGTQTVLDIGCGWGSLLRRLAASGVEAATGLTLSEAQATKIRSDAVPRAFVRQENWAD